MNAKRLDSPKDIFCPWNLDSQSAMGHHLHILFLACHGCTAFPQKNVEPEMPLLRTSQQQETSRTQEFWETGTVVYYETVCKLSPSFLLCGCLFASFCYQSQSLKLFGGCQSIEKRGGRGEAHMKVCHSFLGIWSWVGTLASLPIIQITYELKFDEFPI